MLENILKIFSRENLLHKNLCQNPYSDCIVMWHTFVTCAKR